MFNLEKRRKRDFHELNNKMVKFMHAGIPEEAGVGPTYK